MTMWNDSLLDADMLLLIKEEAEPDDLSLLCSWCGRTGEIEYTPFGQGQRVVCKCGRTLCYRYTGTGKRFGPILGDISGAELACAVARNGLLNRFYHLPEDHFNRLAKAIGVRGKHPRGGLQDD